MVECTPINVVYITDMLVVAFRECTYGPAWEWGQHGNGASMGMGPTWEWGQHGNGANMGMGAVWDL